MKLFLIIFTSIMIASLSIAYVMLEPKKTEPFFSLSTLGSNMSASNYYPRGNTTINIGEEISWYLQVYNRMGSPEFVLLKVKILNSTQSVPDDNTHTPSPEPSIFEINHVITNNSTWITPLKWSIIEIEDMQDYVTIKRMKINGEEVILNVKSIGGDNFRIVIELWRYNPDTKSFEFTWRSGNEYRSTWNQIWLSVK